MAHLEINELGFWVANMAHVGGEELLRGNQG